VAVYLTARWAGVALNPQAIATNSTPFEGLMGMEAAAAGAYMLAVIAGGSLDPNVLALDARCFNCGDGELDRFDNYLLGALAGDSTDPNVLSAEATAFQSVPIMQSILYLLSLRSGVSAAALPGLSRCFLCNANGELDRIITMLLADIQGGTVP